MWDWKESIEHCFFTNHLDKHLKEFLNSQKLFSCDEERWEFLYNTAHKWERKYLTDYEKMRLPSFFEMWNIEVFLATFSSGFSPMHARGNLVLGNFD